MQEASIVYTILTIVGGFGIIALSINAFFLKGIYDRLGTVEIAQATIFADGKSRENRISSLETEMAMVEKELARSRERLHSLEGMNSQVLDYLKDSK